MKYFKKLTALLMALMMVAGLSACTTEPTGTATAGGNTATDKKDTEKTEETLVLGTSADFAPYEFHKMVNGKDTILGFDVALAQEIADQMGKKLVIKDMDFGNLLTELSNGTVNLVIAGLSPDAERAKQVDFSDPYYTGSQCCVIRKTDAAKYTALESFNGQAVAAQTGSIQEGIVKDQMKGAMMVSLAKIPEEIMQLSAGKVEGVVVERAVAEGYVAKNPDLVIAEFEVPYDAEGSCIAVKKGDKEMLDQVNKIIGEVLNNGKMDEFVKQANEDAEY